MATASNLKEAAYLTYDQLGLVFPGMQTLHTKLADFITACDVVVPDAQPNNRPVGNWLIPMSSLEYAMRNAGPNENCPQLYLDRMVDMVSKLCWSAYANTLITNAQRTAILAAWNTAFGTV